MPCIAIYCSRTQYLLAKLQQKNEMYKKIHQKSCTCHNNVVTLQRFLMQTTRTRDEEKTKTGRKRIPSSVTSLSPNFLCNKIFLCIWQKSTTFAGDYEKESNLRYISIDSGSGDAGARRR